MVYEDLSTCEEKLMLYKGMKAEDIIEMLRKEKASAVTAAAYQKALNDIVEHGVAQVFDEDAKELLAEQGFKWKLAQEVVLGIMCTTEEHYEVTL